MADGLASASAPDEPGCRFVLPSSSVLVSVTECMTGSTVCFTGHIHDFIQVTRAEALLRNLEQERDRWSMSSESFTKQLQSLIGDGLLAAAFITYVGVFDYRTRKVSD